MSSLDCFIIQDFLLLPHVKANCDLEKAWDGKKITRVKNKEENES